MKPPTARKGKAPTLAFRRQQLLNQIRVANLPKEADQFLLSDLRETGLANKYHQPSDMRESHFKTFVLLAVQSQELRRECNRLRLEIENRTEYYSPIRDTLRLEPDPLKQAEIIRLAEAEEAEVARKRESARQAHQQDMQNLANAFARHRWMTRDKRFQPSQAVFWHEPMTVMAYHEATGLTRRTLQNILRRNKAAPLGERHRQNVPARYGVEVNFAVLQEWLIKYEKNHEHRRAWLVRTLAKCAYEMPDHLEDLVGAAMPVFKSLGIDNPANAPEFMEYYHKCKAYLYPSVTAGGTTTSGISELVAIYSAPDQVVGKII